MAEKMRKIKYSLLAAAGVSVITAAVCFASAPTQKNASSLVYFPDGNDGTALLRDAISADMNKTAQQSGTPADELERSLSVEPFGSGAEIVLSGLKSTDNAPVILASTLGNAVKSGKAEFDVISYCDMAENVQFPSLPVSFSAGIAGGLAVYAAMSIAEALKKKKSDAASDITSEPVHENIPEQENNKNAPTEPARTEPTAESEKSVSSQPIPPVKSPEPQKTVPIIGAVQRFYDDAVDLGVLAPSAPQGLELAGYIRIARALSEQKSPLIIAISSARTETDKIPYSVKTASYLSLIHISEPTRPY